MIYIAVIVSPKAECYSGKVSATYARSSTSTGCKNGEGAKCAKNEDCVGGGTTSNFVYKLEGKSKIVSSSFAIPSYLCIRVNIFCFLVTCFTFSSLIILNDNDNDDDDDDDDDDNPWMDNRTQKEGEETLKYAPLRLELKRQYPGFRFRQFNNVIDALGGYSTSLKALVGSDRYREVLRRMQKAVLSHTLYIAKAFKVIC